MKNKIHLKIGRAKGNNLVIDREDIAPFHLELFSDTNGNVFITDLASQSGTFVNGKRLEGYTMLAFGDRVTLGGSFDLNWTKLKLKFENELAEKSSLSDNKNESQEQVQTKPLEKKPIVSNDKVIFQEQSSNKVEEEKKKVSKKVVAPRSNSPFNLFNGINFQLVLIYLLLIFGIYLVYVFM